MIVYLLHTSALNFPNRDCSEQCGDDGLLVHFNDYSIFFCETMRISSYGYSMNIQMQIQKE